MADLVPPRIAIESVSQEGPQGEGKENLESRSDSASGEETEEQPPAELTVPEGKSRNTGRKGRKISINRAIKVSILTLVRIACCLATSVS